MTIKCSDKQHRKILNLVIYGPHSFKTTVSKALFFSTRELFVYNYKVIPYCPLNYIYSYNLGSFC